MWGLFTLIAAVAQPAAAEEPWPGVPQSYLDCAARFREELRQSDDARFGCTRAYLDSLPGSHNTTIEMNRTRSDALEIAHRYVDRVLVPELEARLTSEVDSSGNYVLAKAYMLENVVGAGRLQANSSCDLVAEMWGAGTGRPIADANCHVRQVDGLIENLFRIMDEGDPVG